MTTGNRPVATVKRVPFDKEGRCDVTIYSESRRTVRYCPRIDVVKTITDLVWDNALPLLHAGETILLQDLARPDTTFTFKGATEFRDDLSKRVQFLSACWGMHFDE